MDIRALSNDQLKEIKKDSRRRNRTLLFFKAAKDDMIIVHSDVRLSDVIIEIARRKTENLKLGQRKTYT